MEIDIESQKKTPLFTKRLRPEFISEYCPSPLSNGAFINPSKTPEAERDDIEVASAGLKLKKDVIPSLVKLLDKLEMIPMDSISISQAFHTNGVNLRFLGDIANLTTLPHIKVRSFSFIFFLEKCLI